MARTVQCVKLGRELPGLDRRPYPGELGQRIYDQVSAEAWDMWMQQSANLINHYGLSLADPRAQEFLRIQMEEFLFGDQGALPEGWMPDTAPSKGAGRKK